MVHCSFNETYSGHDLQPANAVKSLRGQYHQDWNFQVVRPATESVWAMVGAILLKYRTALAGQYGSLPDAG